MKLKSVQCYQGVQFNKKVHTFLTDSPSQQLPNLLLEFKDGVIHVSNEHDHILVFPANVAYAVPLTAATKAKGAEVRGNIPDMPSAPKRG